MWRGSNHRILDHHSRRTGSNKRGRLEDMFAQDIAKHAADVARQVSSTPSAVVQRKNWKRYSKKKYKMRKTLERHSTNFSGKVIEREEKRLEKMIYEEDIRYVRQREVRLRTQAEMFKLLGARFAVTQPAGHNVQRDQLRMGVLPCSVLDMAEEILNEEKFLDKVATLSIEHTTVKPSGQYGFFHAKENTRADSVTAVEDKAVSGLGSQLMAYCSVLVNALRGDDEEEFRRLWHCKMGVVRTAHACHQVPHLDFDITREELKHSDLRNDYFTLHAPMSREGGVLAIWETLKDDPFFLYIPFGCFAITSGDLFHSGFYGSKGNVRLHIALLREPFPDRDWLYPLWRERNRLKAAGYVEKREGESAGGQDYFDRANEKSMVFHHYSQAWSRVLRCLRNSRCYKSESADDTVGQTPRIRRSNRASNTKKRVVTKNC